MHSRWLVVAALATGCVGESVYTTRGAGIPVLVGPIKQLRDPAPNPGRPQAPVEHEIDQFFFYSSRSRTDRHGWTHTRTSVGWLHEGAGEFDEAFAIQAERCPMCTPHVNSLDVGSWHIFLIGLIAEKNWADLDGSINGY